MNAIVNRQRDVLADGIIPLNLGGEMFSRLWIAERHGRGGASSGYQLLRKFPEPMRHLEVGSAVQEVPPAEFLCAGVVSEPREPVVPDLERRCIGEIDLAE